MSPLAPSIQTVHPDKPKFENTYAAVDYLDIAVKNWTAIAKNRT